MVEYICNRCGYNAKQKINLMRHLNRKNICKPILEDISIEEVKFIYGFEMNHNESKMNPNESKLTHERLNPIDSKMTPIDSKMTPIDSKMTPIEKNK